MKISKNLNVGCLNEQKLKVTFKTFAKIKFRFSFLNFVHLFISINKIEFDFNVNAFENHQIDIILSD